MNYLIPNCTLSCDEAQFMLIENLIKRQNKITGENKWI